MSLQNVLERYKAVCGHNYVDNVDRLEFLLSLVNSNNDRQQENKPWYPDDSGEWVEHTPGDPMPVDGDVMVEFMFRGERQNKECVPCKMVANKIIWGKKEWSESQIVAYKVAR